MSAEANAFLMVSGPSGVGKTALTNGLIARWPALYARPLSYTSRPRRSGEGNLEYQFTDKDWILKEFQRGNLANLDTVYGNLYAMDKPSIEEALGRGLSPVKEIHPSNHFKLRRAYHRCAAVIVLPDEKVIIPDNSPSDTRRREDANFYSNICLDEYEIVTRSFKASGVECFIEDAHRAIQAYLSGLNQFPSPGEIDAANSSGYGKLAGHFTALERPTTANFHDLSAAFFSKAIGDTPAGARCLEVGAGQGWLRKSFHWPQVQYVATDIAANMLATLDFEKCDAERIVTSVRAMPFASASFDCVFSSLGDGYCYPTALSEIRRVLKPNGRLYFSAPSGVWASGLRSPAISDRTQFQLPNNKKADVFSFTFSLAAIKNLFKSCGFRLVLAEEICGDKLPAEREVSTALSESARSLNLSLRDLKIINTVIAIKDR